MCGALSCVMCGCQPNLGPTASVVNGLRLLGMSATPAEATPGTTIQYAALLVDQTGERPDLAKTLDWAFCNDPKPLSDLDDINPACFTFGQSFLVELGQGPTAMGSLPFQACSLFGPNPPPPMAGMPPGRPADPDPSGGYYQPVRLILQTGGQLVLGAEESRISCSLPGATSTTLTEFRNEYNLNTNPVIVGVQVVNPQTGAPLGTSVTAGSTVTLRTTWPSCALGATSCGGAEVYAFYDELAQTVTPRCEQLTVAWYANLGSFATDTSTPDAGADNGLEEPDAGADAGAPSTAMVLCDGPTFVDGSWTAPSTAGTALIWAVLRDDRGGSTWQQLSITVTP